MSGKIDYSLVEDILHRHANVNAFSADWIDLLKAELFNPKFPEKAEVFRRSFAEIILREKLTPEKYELLTGEDFDTQEELNIWLRQLWQDIFGNAELTC